jgi:1-acyl-sn-glycerol-3-phosphate acyltransferase
MTATGADQQQSIETGDPGGTLQQVTRQRQTVMTQEETDGPPEQQEAPMAKPAQTPASDATHQKISQAGPVELGSADEGFIHRVTPLFKLLRLYSRLEVMGLENIGEKGAILAANHTGWIGLDYTYTALSIYDGKKRIPRGMAHSAWFKREATRGIASRLGLFEANKDTLRNMVQQDELVILFPEGEKGAFKDQRQHYVLQPFARGYIRVAMETGVPIIPVAIIGGEESNPSSGQIDSYEALLDLSLPKPQNFFPRPVKWAISFLEPVHIKGGEEAAADRERVELENQRVRSLIQSELQRLQSLRGHPFL